MTDETPRPYYDPELAKQNRLLCELREAFPDGLGFGTCEVLTPADDPLKRAVMYVKIENSRIVKASYDPDDVR